MPDIITEWHRVERMQEAARRAGWKMGSGWNVQKEARESAQAAFDIYGVEEGAVLFVPIGMTASGKGAVAVLGNFPPRYEVIALRDGPAGWSGRYADVLQMPKTDYITNATARGAVQAEDINELARGTRCAGYVKGSRSVVLCIAVGGGRVQLAPYTLPVLWSDALRQVKPLDNRDGAFDSYWAEGKTEWSCHRAFVGSLAKRQRTVNGQPAKGQQTRPSQALGPARVILPGEAQAAASAPHIAPQRHVAPAPSNVVPFTPPAVQPAVLSSARQPRVLPVDVPVPPPGSSLEVWRQWRALRDIPDETGIAPAWRVWNDYTGEYDRISEAATLLMPEAEEEDMASTYAKMGAAGFSRDQVDAWQAAVAASLAD